MILDLDVAPVDITELVQCLLEGLNNVRRACRWKKVQDADPGDSSRRLRPRRNWPRRPRAAEQRDELAPPDHSMTSSARTRSVGGTSRPSAFAVLRLIAISN